jgi:hypothetical protein
MNPSVKALDIKPIANKKISKACKTSKPSPHQFLPDIKYVNDRINKEICYNTINKLTDSVLLPEYKKCKSVQSEIDKLTGILNKHNILPNLVDSIIADYLLELIPAGTKGVIRGNRFNKLVAEYILNMNLDSDRFDIQFEQQCQDAKTDEIPDWFIQDKISGKVIIGMNQLCLIGGGQQINRGSKYLIDSKHNTNNSKLVCVICNYIQFKSSNNKAYKLFDIGFTNNTLCYINNIGTIITNYFGLSD